MNKWMEERQVQSEKRGEETVQLGQTSAVTWECHGWTVEKATGDQRCKERCGIITGRIC